MFLAGNAFASKGRSLLHGIQPWLAMLGERAANWWESRGEQQAKAGTLQMSPAMKGCNNLLSLILKGGEWEASLEFWEKEVITKKKAIHRLLLRSCYSRLADIYRKQRLGWILRNNFQLLGWWNREQPIRVCVETSLMEIWKTKSDLCCLEAVW